MSTKYKPGTLTLLAEELISKVEMSYGEWLELSIHKLRAKVLISDAVFDDLLQSLLEVNFSQKDKDVAKLFDHKNNGPLCSLTQKARLAYALGLINKTALNDLNRMHIVRNRYAHLQKPSFSDPEIAKACSKLSTTKGHKVTANNYMEFYTMATRKYLEYFTHKLFPVTKEKELQKPRAQNSHDSNF